MQQDFNWLSVRSHDDDFGDTAVESLGGFVGTLLGLLVVGGLLDEIQKCDGQICVCQGECFFGHDGYSLIGVVEFYLTQRVIG